MTIYDDVGDDSSFLATTAYNDLFDFCVERGIRLELFVVTDVAQEPPLNMLVLGARAADRGFIESAAATADAGVDAAAERLAVKLRRLLPLR